MADILVVGIAAVDIINTVEHFPAADEEIRALEQRIVPGGNACNTAIVLSQLGDHVAWAGMLADDAYAQLIRHTFKQYAIDDHHSAVDKSARSPVSFITLVKGQSSRSIVHYRELPELAASDFDVSAAVEYDWIHFEGRHIEQTRTLLDAIRRISPSVKISVEIEKPRANIESLITYAQLVFYSRPYVTTQGFSEAQHFLQHQYQQYSYAIHVVTWGEQGAYLIDQAGELFHSTANQGLGSVVDTVAAGDTFNAGFIHAFVSGSSASDALDSACWLAGKKCTQLGLQALPVQDDMDE